MLKGISGGEKQIGQMDIIKCLSNMANTSIVFFGTYQLCEMINLNGQLGRRVFPIHFSRYQKDENYLKFLRTLSCYLPLKNEPDLIDYSDFIYGKTLGCFGILKDWLSYALTLALDTKRGVITKEILKKSQPLDSTIEKIYTETSEGEPRLIKLLKVQEPEKNVNVINVSSKQNLRKKMPKYKPFQRKPRRYKTGTGEVRVSE